MLPKPCFGCGSRERDPGRTKTCAKGHYLCSSCHKGRRTCPFCEAVLQRQQQETPSLFHFLRLA